MSFTVRSLYAVIAVALAGVVLACSADGDSSTPAATHTAPALEASPTPRQGAPADGPSGPGPLSGRPCPVAADVCEFAKRLHSLATAGSIDGLVGLAEPIEATCPSAGFGGPSPSLCAGAAPGEIRRGFWDIQAGEGLIVTEAEWRRTLGRWLAGAKVAQGSDVYGPGTLRVGAVSCTREPSQASGVCAPGNIRVHLTFVNSPLMDPAGGTGLPGQRISFSFLTHRNPAGELRLDGVGMTVPPNTVLLAWVVDAVDASGRPTVIEYYPWTP